MVAGPQRLVGGGLGTNLTNKLYSTGDLNFVEGFGTNEASIAPPREWGVTVRRTF